MRNKATITELVALYNIGIIGKIEFRNWLAKEYSSFNHARRADVDEWLEGMGTRLVQEAAEESDLIE